MPKFTMPAKLDFEPVEDLGMYRSDWTVNQQEARADADSVERFDAAVCRIINHAPMMLAALRTIAADGSGLNCQCMALGWFGDGHTADCPIAIAEFVIAKADGTEENDTCKCGSCGQPIAADESSTEVDGVLYHSDRCEPADICLCGAPAPCDCFDEDEQESTLLQR